MLRIRGRSGDLIPQPIGKLTAVAVVHGDVADHSRCQQLAAAPDREMRGKGGLGGHLACDRDEQLIIEACWPTVGVVRLGDNEIDVLGAQAAIGNIQILEPAYECVLAEFVVAPRIYHGLRITMARAHLLGHDDRFDGHLIPPKSPAGRWVTAANSALHGASDRWRGQMRATIRPLSVSGNASTPLRSLRR